MTRPPTLRTVVARQHTPRWSPVRLPRSSPRRLFVLSSLPSFQDRKNREATTTANPHTLRTRVIGMRSSCPNGLSSDLRCFLPSWRRPTLVSWVTVCPKRMLMGRRRHFLGLPWLSLEPVPLLRCNTLARFSPNRSGYFLPAQVSAEVSSRPLVMRRLLANSCVGSITASPRKLAPLCPVDLATDPFPLPSCTVPED